MTVELPLQIRSGDIPLTGEVEGYIRERSDRLRSFAEGITGCRVTIEAPINHHQKGGPYAVSINVVLPGAQLVVNRRSDANLHAAIRQAFDAVARQLEDHVRRVRGQVKAEVAPPHGRISRLFPEDGYGFITSDDNREVYFHRNSVLAPGFDSLELGQEVRYAEEAGDRGPQASTVTPVKAQR
ncbi:MAG: HPF/RaiA family ribosome-associated protein [Dehalococcoidia bacterium]|nr:HPF/RaiA family ribosome-associated protein [Chloroflexi bacterium CFX7]MCK6565520.1 cold shock domain-containing protein [Dehalococcoidia bacterium]NUQ56225.1 HPF/RaiA family ribosome-associated protein [Dehalococcoidia bacterium]RIL01530.1 MAG: 30S ribosomal protein S30 [bacterium]